MASIRERPNRPSPFEVQYRDPEGVLRSQSFRLKRDAKAFAEDVEADKRRGQYIDPQAGARKFGEFAEEWLAAQTFDVSTRAAVRSRLDRHILPTFTGKRLSSVKPSTVQAWLRGRQQECAPSTVRVLLANLSAILNAAVADGLLPANPCGSSAVKAPRVDRGRIIPWTVEQVQGIVAAHPDRYRAVPSTASGLGLRQGETFGMAVDAVDFLRRTVHVRQQLKLVSGRPVFAPPKGGKDREVPLPDVVADALSEHIAAHPPVEVTLPWRDLDGPPRTAMLLFTSRETKPINRNHYNPYTWKPALETVGIAPTRDNGMHALRHHYASVMLSGGVSIRALAAYLGHSDPGFTLRIYAHLMPDDETRARSVMDSAHGSRGVAEVIAL